jgi:hypothetical protein
VIRIWNNDVIENLDGVLQTLLSELEIAPTRPSPSKRGEGDEIGDGRSHLTINLVVIRIKKRKIKVQNWHVSKRLNKTNRK